MGPTFFARTAIFVLISALGASSLCTQNTQATAIEITEAQTTPSTWNFTGSYTVCANKEIWLVTLKKISAPYNATVLVESSRSSLTTKVWDQYGTFWGSPPVNVTWNHAVSTAYPMDAKFYMEIENSENFDVQFDITKTNFLTGVTTGAVTSARLTTNALTTKSLTTKPLTTKPLTTKALTTKEITTKPLTTKPLTTKPLTTKALTTKPLTTAGLTTGALTSGEVTTASITSGVVTTGSVTSNCTRQCWNGDCVAQLSDCPVMPPCEDMTRRCDNQTCVLFEDVCEQPTCLPGETVCADGQCASSPSLCSSYNGCPFGQFMCPDGLCADEVSECLCVNEGQYRCVDGSCDENPADCGEVPYTVKPQETTFYVNLSSTHDEDFVLPILDSETHQKLCTIIFPKISSDLRLQVFVHGVPDSDLRSYASIDVRNILSAVISLDIQITDANGDVVPIESLSDEVIQFSCDVAHHQNIDENAICLYTFGEDAESAECKEAAAKNIGEGSLRISNRASFAFLLGSEDDSSASSSEEAFRKSYVVIAVGVSLGLAVVGVIAVVIYMKKRRRGVLNATGSRASRSKSFSMPSSRLNTLSLAAVIPMRPKSQVDPEMGSRPSSTLGDNTSRPPSTVETA